VRLSNKILESKDPLIQKYTEENAKWKEYVENQLAETNERDRTSIGGKDPRVQSPILSSIRGRFGYLIIKICH